MKRSDLDATFREQVKLFEIQGVSKRLDELKAAQVPGREKKLRFMIDCIAESVRSKLTDADNLITSGAAVEHIISQLRDADREVGEVMRTESSLDITVPTQNIEARVTEHFATLLTELEAALTDQDLRKIAMRRSSADKYQEEIGRLLSGN